MNEKMLEEIYFIRKVKSRIKDLKFLTSLNEQAVFLKPLDNKEFELTTAILRNNNNIKMYEEDGIETPNKVVKVPVDPNNSNYEEIRSQASRLSLNEQIVCLNDVVDGVRRNLVYFDFTTEEKDKYLEYIKEYLNELKLLKKQRENNSKYNSDIYTESEEYTPLTQKEIFTELHDKLTNEENKSK